MSKVEVLCPNGYRVSVNVLPNTRIYKILEEACLKQGFLPIKKYELKHGRKSLELSATFDKSGLINNSKIELMPLKEEWKEEKVEVNIQTSDGKRVKKDFTPQHNLFEVLKNIGDENQLDLIENNALKPVLVYVNEQFVGNFELQNTTLKNLGLFKGRTLFRHMFREIENKTLLEIEEKIKKENTRYQKLLEVAKEKEKENKERQKIESENKKLVHERSITAIKKENSDPKTKKVETQDKEININNKETIKKESTNKEEKKTEVKKDDTNNFQANPFKNFKFPEATKGKDVYKNELSDYKKEEFQACDREILIYTLLEHMEVDYPEDVPDDFYNVTESDAALMQKRLQRKVRELAEQPLQTEEGRRRMREDMYGKYQRSLIRFQFASGHVVQAVFMIRESVNALYKLVGGVLEEGVKFELYTSPPKLVLKDMTLNLIEANLVPMSIVYVSIFSQSDATSTMIKGEVLQDLLSTHAQAELHVHKWLPKKEEAKEVDKEADKKKKEKEVKDTSDLQGIKVPKWMQKGKK